MKTAGMALMLAACCATGRGEQPDLILVGSISLPNVQGRIDHLVADTAGHRLFVAALGNNSVEVVDLRTHRVVHSIAGLDEPQGLCYLPQLNRLVVSNGGDGTVLEFDGTSYTQVQSLRLRDDADNVRIAPDNGEIVVGYGTGVLATIDPLTMELKGKMDLAGHPEAFQFETSTGRVYINVPSAGSVLIGERREQKIVSTIRLKEAGANFPMALDEKQHRLFVGCRRPPMLLVLDTKTGRVLCSVATHHDADDVFVDSSKGCVYLSCGEGYIDIVRENNGELQKPESIRTFRGARTSCFVPAEGLLYLAVPLQDHQEARIEVFKTR